MVEARGPGLVTQWRDGRVRSGEVKGVPGLASACYAHACVLWRPNRIGVLCTCIRSMARLCV